MKVFLDTIYAVLDEFVVLIAEEVPLGMGSIMAVEAPEQEGKQELIDLHDLTLIKAVTVLDNTLFDRYDKPKAADIAVILREGIFDKDIDWYETPQSVSELIHFTCH
ncbi:hypothetical protein BDR03DRAFT_1009716 [Suillus americanus]|nr:hypothetical protein BDR03DRAFT_1009716 [Suillus americanus]